MYMNGKMSGKLVKAAGSTPMTCSRVVQKDERFVLCPRNAHRMYLASVLLAAKLMDDNVFNNPYWAKVILLAA